MKNAIPATVGVMVSLVFVGCATTPFARSEQVRKTADGGTILLTKGKDPHEAARQALAAIAAHCKGVYEVVEIAKTGTGEYVSGGAGYSVYGVSVASSSSSPVFGMSITYVCRQPVNLDLNQTVTGWAFLNQKCKTEGDCGGFQCERRNESGVGVCAVGDVGNVGLPLANEGEECFTVQDCMPGLKCYTTATKNYCSK